MAQWLKLLGEFDYSVQHKVGWMEAWPHGRFEPTAMCPCNQCDHIEQIDGSPTCSKTLTLKVSVGIVSSEEKQLAADQQEDDADVGHLYHLLSHGETTSAAG